MAIDGDANLGDADNSGFTTDVFSVDAVLIPGAVFAGSSTILEFELEGSLEPALALLPLALSATGFSGTVSYGDADLLPLTLSGGFADGLTLPPFTLSAIGYDGAAISGDVSIPLFTASGSLEPALPLPLYSAAGVMLSGSVSRADVTLPAFEATAVFGTQSDVALEAFTLAATAVAGNTGVGAADVLSPVLDAFAFQNNSADGDITLGIYAAAGSMSGVTIINGSVTLNPFDVVATSAAGNSGSADITLPLLSVDAGLHFTNIGSATITIPAFVVSGSTGGQIVSGDEALATVVVVSTKIKAVTLYSGLLANSFANFAGLTLAATDDGIVALIGTEDLDVPFNAHVLSGISDLGSEHRKQVLAAYVGYRSSGAMDLNIITDEHHDMVYSLEPRRDASELHAARVKLGRGVDGKYWQWRLATRDGGDFDLNSIRLSAQLLKRNV